MRLTILVSRCCWTFQELYLSCFLYSGSVGFFSAIGVKSTLIIMGVIPFLVLAVSSFFNFLWIPLFSWCCLWGDLCPTFILGLPMQDENSFQLPKFSWLAFIVYFPVMPLTCLRSFCIIVFNVKESPMLYFILCFHLGRVAICELLMLAHIFSLHI